MGEINMEDTALIRRIQSFLRENVRKNHDVVEVPLFTLFFHPNDRNKYFNYAIPNRPTGGDLSAVLDGVRAEFHQRGRVARFEFFEAFAPDLPRSLRTAGFIEEGRQWSMVCTPETFRPAPPVAGVTVVEVTPESPDKDVADFIVAQRQGFDPQDTSLPTPDAINQARVDFLLGGWHALLARVEQEPAAAPAAASAVPAAAAVFSDPTDAISEVAGIATRVAYRRRGIASLLTSYAVQGAFARGAEIATLTAEDEAAGRVYERVGFAPFSIMLAYIDQEAQ
jgi:ribosomal protein S18 acetylase RimI-like enzyme